MKKIAYVGVPAVILVGALVMMRGPKQAADTLPESEKKTAIATSEEPTRLPAGVPPAPTGTKMEATAPSKTAQPVVKLTPTRELEEFASLKRKALLTDKEKEDRARLVQDSNAVKSLLTFLLAPAALGSEEMKVQNDAIDMLLEARAAQSDAALEVIQSVIADSQIENTNLDMQTRMSLAGVKAEVLYHWTAQEPARASELEKWLPGPVSQRIWSNVQEAQKQNQAESKHEAH